MGRKVGRRAGQLYERAPDVWMVRAFLGRDPDTGERHWRSATVRGPKKAAQTKLNEWLRERDTGTLIKPSRETLNAHLDHWLATAAPKRANTRAEYVGILKRYVRPGLGGRRLADLHRSDIKGLYAEMEARGLSPRTIRYTHAVLSSALKAAVEDHRLARNPATGIKLPKQERREMHCLAPDQAAAFLRAAETNRHGILFGFLLATGMRPSEALASRWRDLNLQAGTVSVQRVLVQKGSKAHFAEPKTPRSRRTIPLPASLTTRLKAYKLASSFSSLDDLVFRGEAGQPLNEHNLARRHFKALLTAAGLPSSIRLYDLRHSCATLLLTAGENPKIVSERLGHASITLTLDTYSHVLPNMQQQAAAKLEGLLFGEAARPARP